MGLCPGVGKIGAGASANDLQLNYAREKVYGEVPAVRFKSMRVTSESLSITEDTTNDSEIRNDRMGGTPIRTALNVGGQIGIEPSYRNFEDFKEGAMFSCWQDILEINATDVAFNSTDKTISLSNNKVSNLNIGDRLFIRGSAKNDGEYTIAKIASNNITVEEEIITESIGASVIVSAIKLTFSAGDIKFDSVDNSINSTVFDFSSLNLISEQYIKVLGTSKNNKDFKIKSISTNKNAAGKVSIGGSRLRNGVVNHSFMFEKSQVPTEFYKYTGMMVSEFGLNIATGAVLNGSMTFVGKSEVPAVANTASVGEVKKAYDTKNYNSVSDIGEVSVNGTKASAAVQDLSFTINNNIEQQKQIGSLENAGVFAGNCDISGTISLYYKDKSIYESFLAEDNKTISFPVVFDNKGYRYTINAKLTNPAKNTEGVNQSIIQQYTLTGIPLHGFKMEIDRF
ncbi:MAG: phage tail tube protein [Bacilli bacterium]